MLALIDFLATLGALYKRRGIGHALKFLQAQVEKVHISKFCRFNK
jgi:hypothetical protein